MSNVYGDEKIKTWKVGSRQSELAMIQTNFVIGKLKEINPTHDFEIIKISTLGDKILDKALPKIGEKSLFTKELEDALESGMIDFVVHSLKDLPTTLPPRKAICAILEREDPRDVLILNEKHNGKSLSTLPKGSVIGTSSLRRSAQLSNKFPDLKTCSIRGNINTRLKKLDEGLSYDGIILAMAGIKRIGWGKRVSQTLDKDVMMYAVGQGALAVECQEDNKEILVLLKDLNHEGSVLTALSERSFLKKLGGGCSAPVAVHSHLEGNIIQLTGAVYSLDGNDMIVYDATETFVGKGGDATEDNEEPMRKLIKGEQLFCGISPGGVDLSHMARAQALGEYLADKLIKDGAVEIMALARQTMLNSA